MRLIWMPYLRVAYGFNRPKELQIGNARFLPDTDDVWQSETGQARPEYLRLFRDFPPVSNNGAGDPIYGTVVVSSDEGWLDQHIETAIAILFFLGDKTKSGIPAEVFTYKPINLTSDAGGSLLVQFNTKHGPLTESGDSIVLYPPLAVRGIHGEYRIDCDRTEHQALMKRFAVDPNDRVAVAVRHYFRAQFSDVFTSTLINDYATYCSATEAALDIQAGIGTGDEFVLKLTDQYGKSDELELFFLGWYGARSLHVHGASEIASSTEADKKRTRAYSYFRSIRGKWTVVRAICREVILRALGYTKPELSLNAPPDAASPYLTTALFSDEVWKGAKKVLTVRGAADSIFKMSEGKFAEIQDLASRFSQVFDWNCVRENPQPKDVFRAIVTCAILIGRLTDSTGPDYAASDALGNAASDEDRERIADWLSEHLDWKDKYACDRLETIQLLMWHVAAYFEK